MDLRDLARFYLERLALACAFLLIASVCVFSLVHLAPGDPVRALLGTRPATPETIMALRIRYHLDDPLVVQYVKWLAQILHADLGRSISGNRSVVEMLGERVGVTAALVLISTLVVLPVGVFLGVVAAFRPGSRLDRAAVVLGVLGISFPAFVTGVVLLYVFSAALGWFPAFGAGTGFANQLWHLVLPSLALVLSVTAIVMKITRTAVIEELAKDYVTFARSRSLSRVRIAFSYVLRNALIPVVTAAGIVVMSLIANAVYVEVTFALPGLGSLMVDAVQKRDFPVIQGATLAYMCFVIILNLIIDGIYAVVDPRIRFSKVSA
jgi:peptide/nickel transport system permease protein